MHALAIWGEEKSVRRQVCAALSAAWRRQGVSVGLLRAAGDETGKHQTQNGAPQNDGPELVALMGEERASLVFQRPLSLGELAACFHQDKLLLEGVTEACCPALLCVGGPKELAAWGELDQRVLALCCPGAEAGQKRQGRPLLDPLAREEDMQSLLKLAEERSCPLLPDFQPDCCSACGHTCRELSGLIAQGRAEPGRCRLQKQETELLIDGQPVAMVPFVQAILRNSVLAVAGELEGVAEHCRVEVRFRR